MRILVLCANADDETLGAGGTIARHVAAGDAVTVVALGEGPLARQQPGHVFDPAALRETAQHQFSTALDVLGAKGWLCDLPDNRFDTVPLLEVIQRIENVLGTVQPKVIYTHHAGDLNVDHRIVHQAVVTATRPVPGSPGEMVRRVLAFEVPSSTEWAFGAAGAAFQPNVFVPLRLVDLDYKMRALRCYASEVRARPHPRSEVAVRALAEWRGAQCGNDHAEAFQLVREIQPCV